MILTDRDKKIMEFVQGCPADSDTICKLFFQGKRTCNERLRKLADYGYLKRFRKNVTENYVYYIKRKPIQIEHCNYVSKAYAWIKEQGYQVEKFKREVLMENIRMDMLCQIHDTVERGYLIVEVELSNNNINKKIMKYEDFYLCRMYKKYFDTMPKILYVSKRKVKSDIIEVINVKLKDL